MNIKHTPVLDQAAIEGSYLSSSLSWAQLQRGTFDIGYSVLEEPPLRVAYRTYNVAFQVEAKIAPSRIVVAVLANPRGLARWFGTDFASHAIATTRDAIDVRTDGASAFFSITVDEAELHRAYPRSADAERLSGALGRAVLTQDPITAQRIRALAARALVDAAIAPRMTSGTLIPLLASALESVDTHGVQRTKCLNRRFAAVRACERYMRDHIDATVTLLDLSQIAGMRSRSLINAFEAVTGLSPMDYLKRLRLNGVHRALSRPAKPRTRIIDVATAWGFWHMGHFTTDYRTMFGEAPSQTLFNSQRHLAVG
jgi:AraC family transcriptional regulator, ethanolamine operon transcriptional activator